MAAYMQFYNEKQIFGKTDAQIVKDMDFQHEWGVLATRKASAAECIECGQCEEACTQHLPIIERLAEVARLEAEAAKK